MASRHWTWDEKRRAVERMREGKHAQLAKEIGIHKRQLYSWRKQLAKKSEHPAGFQAERDLERENQQLREVLARKVLEVDFLQGALRSIEARRRASDGCGGTASTKKSAE